MSTRGARLILSVATFLLLVLSVFSCYFFSQLAKSPALPATTAATWRRSPSPTVAGPAAWLSMTPDVPTPTPLPTEPPNPTPTLCPPDVCTIPAVFVLDRPIAPPARNTVDPSFRFGDSERDQRDPHHGVEFLVSNGVPVLAAADGVVVVAGDDRKTVYGLYPYYYGNLVILKHELPGYSQPLYTLYGHLSRVDVQVDQTVKVGDTVGAVGSSGAATGSHLHFEVRYGENAYAASRNPELFLKPLLDEAGQPQGAIAGRIIDAQGRPLKVKDVVIERLSTPGSPVVSTVYLSPYAEAKLVGQDPWEECFATGDLPAGEYQISFVYRGMQNRVVQVLPGQLTLVTFQFEN